MDSSYRSIIANVGIDLISVQQISHSYRSVTANAGIYLIPVQQISRPTYFLVDGLRLRCIPKHIVSLTYMTFRF